jgi:hypothetical protein
MDTFTQDSSAFTEMVFVDENETPITVTNPLVSRFLVEDPEVETETDETPTFDGFTYRFEAVVPEAGLYRDYWTADGGYQTNVLFEVVESLFEFAGKYSEDLQDIRGNGYRNATVAVQTLAGAATTLYLNRLKGAYVPASGLAANEIKADAKGNLQFFSEPGQYQIVVTPVGGSAKPAYPITVYPDPMD